MANFSPRNVLICVVPTVILLLSVYWFKKKKKMKPDPLSPLNTNTLSVNKTSDTFDSQGSIYSSVECSSDFSNTLSDASSISSPENCVRTQGIACKSSNSTVTVIRNKVPVSVLNHIEHLNYESISLNEDGNHANERKIISINTRNCENPKIELLSEVQDCEKITETKNDNLKLKERDNSICIVEETSLFNIENNTSESDIAKIVDHNQAFSKSLYSDIFNSQNIETEKKQCLNIYNTSDISKIINEPVAELKNTFISNASNHLESSSALESVKLVVEADIHDSHSSVLDENSLSSISDESEQQIDFKSKDSPSSVFDTNSLSDESEKNINNSEPSVLQSQDECKDNIDHITDEVQSSICDGNKDEQYSIQLNKNSFFTSKTILTSSDDNKNSSSDSFVSENSNSANFPLNSQTAGSLQNSPLAESYSTNKGDSGIIVEHNSVNKPIFINENNDFHDNHSKDASYILLSSRTSTFEDISSSSQENIISCSSVRSRSASGEQLEVPASWQNIISSTTDEVSEYKDSVELNGTVQLDSISSTQTDTLSETLSLKAEDGSLEDKVSEFDADMKGSGMPSGPFVYEFELPQELCGRLIGKQGKHVKSIKERTNANVFIKRHPFDSNLKTVVVEGSRSAVHDALDIIRRKFPPAQFPTVTLLQTNLITSHSVSVPEYLQLHLPEGASCDVILSSLLTAGHFFLQQPTHPTYPSLSTLDQCMISCYSQMDTPLLPHPVEAGVICAAPVMNGWFRAQVIYVYENRNECELKFVDYGGFSSVLTASLRQIRSDFMTLPFQASECYLANVRPIDVNAGWSSEATAVFEELAQGQILQALLVEYAEDGIPCVYLYRVQGVTNMFINRELVERGLAVWVDNGHWDPH